MPLRRRPLLPDLRTAGKQPSAASRLARVFFAILVASSTGCTHVLGSQIVRSPVAPFNRNQSLSVGEWSGTTSQGMPIAFTVSDDEILTKMTIGHDFNGCMDTESFEDVQTPTTSNLTCIPGPCPNTAASYRSLVFVSGSDGHDRHIQVNGVFLPFGEARGQAVFSNFPACGSATAEWTATRR